MSSTQATERSLINNPTARVQVFVNAPIKVAFDYIQPVPLNTVFLPKDNFPGVSKTDEAEYWIYQNKSRTVTFTDGNTAFETMLYVDYPNYFSYKIENFSSETLGGLIERVDGSWVFSALQNNQTLIDWKYVLIARNEDAKKIIEEHVLPGFQGMLEGGINKMKEFLESK